MSDEKALRAAIYRRLSGRFGDYTGRNATEQIWPIVVRELAVRDEALAEIAALRVAILKIEREIEADGGLSWELLGIANDIQRILANLQRSLDPYRDDKEQRTDVP